MYFQSWSDLLRVLLVGVPAYVCLVLFVRLAGKRSLAKMNAFDLVVTVAIGSVLATTILSKDVSLAQGLAALGLLLLLQYLVAWTTVRSKRLRRTIMAEPRLLAHKGRMLDAAMRRERVSADDLMAAVRSSGRGGLEEVSAVVLESDGSLSVLSGGQESTAALAGVQGVEVSGPG